ncbi:hypothetical protein B0H65DRAFT_157921 [Neurospora tetraspora]|uniref:Uncharacterized protein n=1 Tax=Neurospora tetraspora TaxID=94610 RepID=A0AAE0JHD5_9PEZI|nr:hypothetical protein B0H65DRAFT_157921 [Neurospora tetraspora]
MVLALALTNFWASSPAAQLHRTFSSGSMEVRMPSLFASHRIFLPINPLRRRNFCENKDFHFRQFFQHKLGQRRVLQPCSSCLSHVFCVQKQKAAGRCFTACTSNRALCAFFCFNTKHGVLDTLV